MERMRRSEARPVRRPRTVAAAWLATLGLAACSGTPEEAFVSQFFRAIAQGDRATLAAVSLVPFPAEPPASWTLVEVSPETAGPYRVPALREEEQQATRRRDDQFQEFSAFRSANQEALREIAERRDARPDANFSGRLGRIEAEWETHREERRMVREALAEAQMALDAERRRAQRSLDREAPVDYLTGSVVVRDLIVEADGVRYRFTLMRYDLVNQFDDPVPARWLVTSIEPADGASGAAPDEP